MKSVLSSSFYVFASDAYGLTKWAISKTADDKVDYKKVLTRDDLRSFYVPVYSKIL